jgi:hypothetical protein
MRNSLSPAKSTPSALKTYRDNLAKLTNMVSLNDLLEWYASDLVLETQKWLAKTLKNAWTTKENSYNLPWDVTQLNGMYISKLPETLMSTLNVYLDLCASHLEISSDGNGNLNTSEADAKSELITADGNS